MVVYTVFVGFRIECSDLPELCGTYELEYEDQYRLVNEGVNILIKHPMEDMWCVSNGDFFIAIAADTSADPAGVKSWKIRQKNRMVLSSSVTVCKL